MGAPELSSSCAVAEAINKAREQYAHLKRESFWLNSFEEFSVLWSLRNSDLIERGHPMEQWIWRQRKFNRQGLLADWKVALLDQIGFPMVGSRISAQADDLDHAKSLVAFYREHGHYCPSVTIGGNALRHWVRKMRDSNGARGLYTGTGESARAADAFVRSEIPEFSWANTIKSFHNRAIGLTHNGYQKSIGRKPHHYGPSSRVAYVVRMAKKALELGHLCTVNTAIAEYSANYGEPELTEFADRSAFFRQPVAVHLADEESEVDFHPGTAWWIVGAREVDVEGCSRLRVCLHSQMTAAGQKVCLKKDIDLVYSRDMLWGYTFYGDRYFASMQDANDPRRSVLLSYDVLVADQTHPNALPVQWLGCADASRVFEPFDWGAFTQPETIPIVVNSIAYQGCSAFAHNFEALAAYVNQRLNETPGEVPHLGWGKDYKMFKTVEHFVRRASSFVLPFSHADRLSQLNFTWGRPVLHSSDFPALRIGRIRR